MTADQKSYSFRDEKTLDQILERALQEHRGEFKDKSDLLRKSLHFLLRTLGYQWDLDRAEKAVNALIPKSEGEGAIKEILAVDEGRRR